MEWPAVGIPEMGLAKDPETTILDHVIRIARIPDPPADGPADIRKVPFQVLSISHQPLHTTRKAESLGGIQQRSIELHPRNVRRAPRQKDKTLQGKKMP